MIEKALKYIVNMREPKVQRIGESWFMDASKPVARLNACLRADALKFSTLQSLVTYIKDNPDRLPGKLLVHVESPKKVRVLSVLNDDRERECSVSVEADIPRFDFGEFISAEKFVIQMRSMFIPCKDNDHWEKILQFAGTSEAGTLAEYGDDGVSQKVTIRTGITQKKDDIVPSPVILRPYRTFTEVEQPESEFIFRMKDSNDGIFCALFEADGGAWRKRAVDNIRDYLVDELSGCNVLVIS